MRLELSKIDKNMAFDTNIDLPDIDFVNIDEAPLDILGVWRYEDVYIRVPRDVAEATNEGVAKELSYHLAGGRVRFMTDSPYVAIVYTFPNLNTYYHITRSCQSGIDMYVDGVFGGVFAPTNDNDNRVEAIKHFDGEKKMREIVINLPAYNTINSMYIGLSKDSVMKKAQPYDKRIVFYGSSITQGGCASRPGNAFATAVARKLNWDITNLGFSGNGRGETVMAEYIASLDMDIFVLDYDHNAPDSEHLKKTHKPFFDIIRNAHPDIPIIMMSKPDWRCDKCTHQRKAVIKSTYDAAIAAGDKNVYFIDGYTLWDEEDYHFCTVDGVHPSDYGMYRMYKKLMEVIYKTEKI